MPAPYYYVGTNSSTYQFDEETDSEQYTAGYAGRDIDASPQGEDLYFTQGTALYRYDTTGGGFQWNSQAGDVGDSVTLDSENSLLWTVGDTSITSQNISDGSLNTENAHGLSSVFNSQYDPSSGDIFIAAESGVYRFTTGGTQVWEKSTPNRVREVEINQDGYVAAGDNDGNVYKLNKSDGSEVWVNTVATEFIYGIDINTNGDILSAELTANKLRKHNSSDGSVKWSFTTSDRAEGAEFGENGEHYVGDETNTVYGVDDSGNQIFTNSVDDNVADIESVDYTPPSPPYYYTAIPDGDIQKFDAVNDEVLWTVPLDFAASIDANGAGDEIYAADYGNEVIEKFDGSGNSVWTKTLSNVQLADGLSLDNDNTYVYVSDGGDLQQLNTSDGTINNTFSISGNIYDVVVGPNDNIYTIDNNNTVYKVAPDGTIEWSNQDSNYALGQGLDVGGTTVAVSGGSNGTIHYLDTSDGTEYATNSDYTDTVESLAVNSDNEVLVGDGVRVRKLDSTATELWTYTGVSNPVKAVDFGEDGVVYSIDFFYHAELNESDGTENYRTKKSSDDVENMEFVAKPVTVEQITASQTSVTGTMNTASAQVPIEQITASQSAVTVTMNTAALTTIESVSATQVVTSATTETGVLSAFYEVVLYDRGENELQIIDDIDGSIKQSNPFSEDLYKIRTDTNYIYARHSDSDNYKISQFNRGDLSKNWTVLAEEFNSQRNQVQNIKPVPDGVLVSWNGEDLAKYDADGNQQWSVNADTTAEYNHMAVTDTGVIYATSDDVNEVYTYDSNGNLINWDSMSNIGLDSNQRFAWAQATENGTALISTGADTVELDENLNVLNQTTTGVGTNLIGRTPDNQIKTYDNNSNEVIAIEDDLTVTTLGTPPNNEVPGAIDGVGGLYFDGSNTNKIYRTNNEFDQLWSITDYRSMGRAPDPILFKGEYQATVSVTAAVTGASSTMNGVGLTEGFDAVSVQSVASMASGEVSITTGATPISTTSTMGNAGVTALGTGATPFTAGALTNTTSRTDGLTATQTAGISTMRSPDTAYGLVEHATQVSAASEMNATSFTLTSYADATQFTSPATMLTTDVLFSRMRYQRLVESNNADFISTENSATITPTVNEVE